MGPTTHGTLHYRMDLVHRLGMQDVGMLLFLATNTPEDVVLLPQRTIAPFAEILRGIEQRRKEQTDRFQHPVCSTDQSRSPNLLHHALEVVHEFSPFVFNVSMHNSSQIGMAGKEQEIGEVVQRIQEIVEKRQDKELGDVVACLYSKNGQMVRERGQRIIHGFCHGCILLRSYRLNIYGSRDSIT